MDELCRKVGFNDEQTKALIGGKPLRYNGTLYSETHRKRFIAENVIEESLRTKQTATNSALKSTGYLLSDGLESRQKGYIIPFGWNTTEKGENMSFIRMNRSLGINSHYEFYTTSIYIVGDVLIFFLQIIWSFKKKWIYL